MHKDSSATLSPESPKAEACGKCHRDVYEEWRQSAHGRAWTAAAFTEASADGKIGACLPCHAPESVFTDGKPPRTREYHREEGVSCLSCHLHEGAQQGPSPKGFAPHPAAGPNPFFRDSALCGTCHRGTYASWLKSKAGDPHAKTCQECHMPETRRKPTVAANFLGKPFVALHKERTVRRHFLDLKGVENFEGALEFEARRSASGLTVVIRNRLPHLVPTGEYGYRHARLTIESLNAGVVVKSYTRDFFRDLGTALPVGKPVEWHLPNASPSRELRATVVSLDESGEVRFEIARQMVNVVEESAGR